MSAHSRKLKALFFVAVVVCVSVLLVLGAERALPLVCTVPVYTPALNSLNPPNLTLRFVSCDFDYTAHFNSLGLRGPGVSIAKTDKFRIAVIGSSYAFGWGVGDDACFARLLERGLQADGIDAEVLNFGKNGGAPGQYALLARETIPLFKPDMVVVAVDQGCDIEWSNPVPFRERIPHMVWTFFPNLSSLFNAPKHPRGGGAGAPSTPDPPYEEIPFSKEGVVKLARGAYDAMPPEQRARFDGLEQKIKDEYFAGNLNQGIVLLGMNTPELFTATLDMNSEHTKARLQFLGKCLEEIADAGDHEGVPTLVVSVPMGAYVNESALKNCRRLGFTTVDGMLATTAPDDAIRTACGDLPFLTVMEAFRRQSSNPRLFFELDLHLSADGHALFAREILPWVEGRVREAMKFQHK